MIQAAMVRANDYFMAKWPDPGKDIVTDKTRPSHIWTRAVYYEGLMALHELDPQPRFRDYAVRWGESHAFGLNGGATTRNADNQCAGQTYIDLYRDDPVAARVRDIKASIDAMVNGSSSSDWTWIDAIRMSMPVFAKLGVLYDNDVYFERMYAFYSHTRNVEGGSGLYSKTDHLWWRDKDFDPPYREPNGEDCYWSRGNGWVYAALTRVLSTIQESAPHRAEYLADYLAMSEALRAVQRSDGFWNVSLHDPNNYAGRELSGTALFAYGMVLALGHYECLDSVTPRVSLSSAQVSQGLPRARRQPTAAPCHPGLSSLNRLDEFVAFARADLGRARRVLVCV
jgi:unsaturated rhamnogalacturonyl hydrolase